METEGRGSGVRRRVGRGCSCTKDDFLPEESFKSWSNYMKALKQTPTRFMDRLTSRSLDHTELHEVKGRSEHEMKKNLTWWDLMWFGIGAVIGAGIFVLKGKEAKDVAGPAVVLSYVVSGVSAMLSVFCYTEFAVEIPVADSHFSRSAVRNTSVAKRLKKSKFEGHNSSGDSKAAVKKVIPGPPSKHPKRPLKDVACLGELSAETSSRLGLLLNANLEAQYTKVSAAKTLEEASVFLLKGMQANLMGSKKIKDLESEIIHLKSKKRSAEEGFHREHDIPRKEHVESTKRLQERIADLGGEMKENAFFFGLKARLEAMAEYARGEHKEWDYSDVYKTFTKEFAEKAVSFQSDEEVQAISEQLMKRLAEENTAPYAPEEKDSVGEGATFAEETPVQEA